MNRNIGVTKMMNHSPVSGPVMRSPSCMTGSSPNSGVKPNSVVPVSALAARKPSTITRLQDAADIAGGPAGAREAPDPVRRHQRRHHRIVEDGGELDADAGDRVGSSSSIGMMSGLPGLPIHIALAPITSSAPNTGDPRLAPAAGVGDGTQHRRQQRDRKPGRGGRKAPQRLPARGI